jgi:hypothetical protein
MGLFHFVDTHDVIMLHLISINIPSTKKEATFSGRRSMLRLWWFIGFEDKIYCSIFWKIFLNNPFAINHFFKFKQFSQGRNLHNRKRIYLKYIINGRNLNYKFVKKYFRNDLWRWSATHTHARMHLSAK